MTIKSQRNIQKGICNPVFKSTTSNRSSGFEIPTEYSKRDLQSRILN